ncbi:TPT-domain-containing protein [Mycena amicta]|nr:TPT-domain-containing protein [Mycena amicta]
MQSFKLPPAPLLHRINLDSTQTPPSTHRGSPSAQPTNGLARFGCRPARCPNAHITSNRTQTIQTTVVRCRLPRQSCRCRPFALPHRRSSSTRARPRIQSSTRPHFGSRCTFASIWGLTLYNKGVLVRFPFPYTLSALHALFGTIGASFLAKHGYFVPSRLSSRETIVLVAFSMLYAVNIVVSNISLQLVTIPFHQVVRAATPIFTISFSAVLLGVQSSYSKKVSLIPVVAGVGLATFGDYYFTYAGFLLTLLGTLLAAFKTIFTNVLQSPTTSRTAYFRNPFDLLYYLSPLALIECLVLAHATGELERVRAYAGAGEMSLGKIVALALNGCIAFGLNVVSFTANRRVGAWVCLLAANVKQVLTIVFAVFIFDLTITTLNAVGIVLTLVGGAWYAWIELVEKQSLRANPGARRWFLD